MWLEAGSASLPAAGWPLLEARSPGGTMEARGPHRTLEACGPHRTLEARGPDGTETLASHALPDSRAASGRGGRGGQTGSTVTSERFG
jgi:hypothetical protein